jgi:uncharacterized membrane protein YsdA (DUF1294 family)
MLKAVGLITLHVACIYFLWLLWNDKNKANERGRMFTKLGNVSKAKSPRLFRFSIWVDFVVLLLLYIVLIVYSLWLVLK